jgi:hypothetical protein
MNYIKDKAITSPGHPAFNKALASMRGHGFTYQCIAKTGKNAGKGRQEVRLTDVSRYLSINGLRWGLEALV